MNPSARSFLCCHTRLMRSDVTPMSNLPVRLLARMYTRGCFTASHRLLVPSYRRRCPASKDSLDPLNSQTKCIVRRSLPVAQQITGIRSFSQSESYRLHSKTPQILCFLGHLARPPDSKADIGPYLQHTAARYIHRAGFYTARFGNVARAATVDGDG